MYNNTSRSFVFSAKLPLGQSRGKNNSQYPILYAHFTGLKYKILHIFPLVGVAGHYPTSPLSPRQAGQGGSLWKTIMCNYRKGRQFSRHAEDVSCSFINCVCGFYAYNLNLIECCTTYQTEELRVLLDLRLSSQPNFFTKKKLLVGEGGLATALTMI